MTEATVETWSALHIERSLQGRAAEGAMGPAMLGLTMAIGRFSGQAVSPRLGAPRCALWSPWPVVRFGPLSGLVS